MIVNNRLTDLQEKALARHLRIAKAQHGLSESTRIDEIAIQYREEARPGRGHDIMFAFVDGDHAFTGSLDPYGYGYMAIAEVSFIHNGADEECECPQCHFERTDP